MVNLEFGIAIVSFALLYSSARMLSVTISRIIGSNLIDCSTTIILTKSFIINRNSEKMSCESFLDIFHKTEVQMVILGAKHV